MKIIGKIIFIFCFSFIFITGCFNENKKENGVNKVDDLKSSKIDYDKIYKDYIKNEEYKKEINKWYNPPSKYAIYDLNKDNIPELFLKLEDMDFNFILIFTYDANNDKISLVDNIYTYGDLRYNNDNEVIYTDEKPFYGSGVYGFYKLENNKLELVRTVGQDDGVYFVIDLNGNKKEITESESNKYYEDLSYINYIEISELD